MVILFIVLIIIISLGLLYVVLYNKFNEAIIRVNEAENRIDDNLRNKYDFLSKCITLVKGKKELDNNKFKDFAMLKSKKISNFDLDRVLVKSYNDLISLCDESNNFRNNDELYKTLRQIEIIDEELVTLRAYYNANIANYNKMVKKIPTMIVAKINKYKERMFYDLKDMTDDDYEDFKL